MRSRGVVYVDETVDEYAGLRLPSNWRKHGSRRWGSLRVSMQWCYRTYPDAAQYGWLADDTIPRTPGWDTELEQAAGDWRLAYAHDLYLSARDPQEVKAGRDLTTGLCWGGELVRAVGWWAPPWLRQAAIDLTWLDLIQPLGLFSYREDVVVEHKSWRNGKRPRDDGDEWVRGGDNYVQRDVDRWQHWRSGSGLHRARGRIAAAVPA
jgi:hypothetical protein